MSNKTHVLHPSLAVDSDSPVHADRRDVESVFYTSDEGNPQGGVAVAEGINVTWQNGVLEPNGAILEDFLSLAVDRLRFFQGISPDGLPGPGKFACRENALAITHIEEAINWLTSRTLSRRRRGVEGTYTK